MKTRRYRNFKTNETIVEINNKVLIPLFKAWLTPDIIRPLFLLCVLLTFPSISFPQLKDWIHLPVGKEVWSEPVRIDSFSMPVRWGWACSLNQSMDTIYVLSGGGDIYTSYRKNGTWQTPKRLNSYINNETPVRHPVISKDGKRLYFSSWRGGYGGWDLYCSSWDSVTKDWGMAENLGPNVNTVWADYFAYELSPDTLYCVTDRWVPLGVCIFVKDKLKNDWKIIDSSYYPNGPEYHHLFGGGYIEGLSITADRKKAYFSKYLEDSSHTELHVTYWDSVNNRWGDTYRLNINTMGYEVKVTDIYSVWLGGVDEYPWISPDGKTLYFTSNRDIVKTNLNSAAEDIYISHLIVDENGDSVTAVSKNTIKTNLTNSLKLLPSYPNPFNSSTSINFELPENDKISLVVYDCLGREKEKLINDEYYTKGIHSLKWTVKNNSGYSSGIYLLRLITNKNSVINKLIYLK